MKHILIASLLLFAIASSSDAAHFDFDTTDGNCSVLVMECYILDGLWGQGDELAVFTADGICAGGTVVSGFPLGIAAWADDRLTENEVEGFRSGDSILFKRWDAQNQQEVSILKEYILTGSGLWESDGLLIVELADTEPYFDINPTLNKHRFTCLSAEFTIGDIRIGPRPGDQAAIRTPGGEIGGMMVWHSEDSASGWAYMDDPVTDELVEGFEPGEEFAFSYWSPMFDTIIDTLEWEIVSGDQVFVRNGNTELALWALGISDGSEPELLETFKIDGAYPNPFNSSTVLTVSLPTSTSISITIYDIEGRVVATQSTKQLDRGIHRIAVSMDNNPAGNYLCKVETLGNFGVVPLTLIR